MHFHEFEDFIRDRKNQTQFAPLIKILQGFTITTKPIFWARLVCLGRIGASIFRRSGERSSNWATWKHRRTTSEKRMRRPAGTSSMAKSRCSKRK